MRSPLFAVLAAACVDVAVAILDPSGSLSVDPSTMGEWQCITALGTQSQLVVLTLTDTDVKTAYLPEATDVTTVYQTSTIQESPLTITNTDTVVVTETVTDSTVTGTFSTTETETVMETATETTGITQTDISTSTTTTTTTATIPAPSGFVGVRDTIDGYPGQSPNKKRNVPDHLRERWLRVCPSRPSQSASSVSEEPTSDGLSTPSPSPTATESVYSEASSNLAITESAYSTASSSLLSGDGGFSGTQFPQSVECRSTTTVQSTTTVTEEGDAITITSTPPVETTEVTTTETTTSTIVPDEVTVTESFDAIVTSTSTTTIITTSTTTSTMVEEATSTAEFYEACGADNSLGPDFRGLGSINGIEDVYRYGFGYGQTPYGCCTLCLLGNRCVGSAYFQGVCNLYTSYSYNTCAAQSSFAATDVAGTW